MNSAVVGDCGGFGRFLCCSVKCGHCTDGMVRICWLGGAQAKKFEVPPAIAGDRNMVRLPVQKRIESVLYAEEISPLPKRW